MFVSEDIAGLSDSCAQLKGYIGNRPDFYEYPNLHIVSPLSAGEIHVIGQSCGNGWRKVFNVYAKLVFVLSDRHIRFLQGAQSWQNYRDGTLVQSSSNTSLLFSKPLLGNVKYTNIIHIVIGKKYT